MSVLSHISPLERHFVLKMLLCIQLAMEVKKLKPLCCRDPPLNGHTYSRPFSCRKCACTWRQLKGSALYCIHFCRYSNSETRYLAGTLIFVTVICTKSIHSSVVIMMPYNLLYIPMRLKWPILSGHTGDFTNYVRNIFM